MMMESESESESEDEGLLEMGNAWLGWVASKVAPGPSVTDHAVAAAGGGEATSTTRAKPLASNENNKKKNDDDAATADDDDAEGSSSSITQHAAMPAQEALESVREMAAETFSETLGGLSNLRNALEQTVRANAGAAWAAANALPARFAHHEPAPEPDIVPPLEAAGPEQETVQWLEVPPPTPEQEDDVVNAESSSSVVVSPVTVTQPTTSSNRSGDGEERLQEQQRQRQQQSHETVKLQVLEQTQPQEPQPQPHGDNQGDDEWTAIEKEEVVVVDTSEEEVSPSASHDCNESGAAVEDMISTLAPGAGLADCLSLFGGDASSERIGALSATAAMRCTRHRASLTGTARREHDKRARNLKKQLDLETEDDSAEEDIGGEGGEETGRPPPLPPHRLVVRARAWAADAANGNDDENALLRVRLEGSAHIAEIVSMYMRDLVQMAEAMAANRVGDTSPAALAAQARSSAQLAIRRIELTTAAMADALGACAPSSSPVLRRRLDDAVVEVLFKESAAAVGHIHDALLRAASLCIATGITDTNGNNDPPPSSL